MNIARLVKTGLLVAAFSVPFSAATVANAAAASFIECPPPETPQVQINTDVISEDLPDTPAVCDLSIKKEVSVNGSTYVDANTQADAATATIGDTVTWKITVTNTSTAPLVPYGLVTVSDVLPSGVDFVSATASNGDGTYASNVWTINTQDDTLPATLTIVTKASAQGTVKNTAAFNRVDTCFDGCNSAYNDQDATNNSDDAYVAVAAKPQVLGDTTTVQPKATLVNTGTGTNASVLAAFITLAAIALTVLVRRKQPATQK